MSMQRPHRAYMMTGGVATAVAALIPGTLVHAAARPGEIDGKRQLVRIGHPSGVVDFQVELDDGGTAGVPGIHSVVLTRTARHIMDGVVHVPTTLLRDAAPAPTVLAGQAQ
jgi:2-methylaconitate cis-trans-isomerase PrpF